MIKFSRKIIAIIKYLKDKNMKGKNLVCGPPKIRTSPNRHRYRFLAHYKKKKKYYNY